MGVASIAAGLARRLEEMEGVTDQPPSVKEMCERALAVLRGMPEFATDPTIDLDIEFAVAKDKRSVLVLVGGQSTGSRLVRTVRKRRTTWSVSSHW